MYASADRSRAVRRLVRIVRDALRQIGRPQRLFLVVRFGCLTVGASVGLAGLPIGRCTPALIWDYCAVAGVPAAAHRLRRRQRAPAERRVRPGCPEPRSRVLNITKTRAGG